MTATDLQVGQTIKLNYDNKDVVFKILIKTSENQFKLFNKYSKNNNPINKISPIVNK